MQRLHIDGGLGRLTLRIAAEDPRRALQQLALPLCDLVAMHIELLRQLQQRLSPFKAAKATFALNAPV